MGRGMALGAEPLKQDLFLRLPLIKYDILETDEKKIFLCEMTLYKKRKEKSQNVVIHLIHIRKSNNTVKKLIFCFQELDEENNEEMNDEIAKKQPCDVKTIFVHRSCSC